MTESNISIGLVIEGIGEDTTAAGGLAWYYGRPDLHGTVAATYEWHGGFLSGAGLVALPASVGAEANPFEATLSDASFSFQLHKDAKASRYLMESPVFADSYLDTAIEADGTTISLTSSTYTYSASDDGTIVWVGDEAILLGTYSAGDFTGCTRAMFSTTGLYQPAGMSVYRQNPKREFRLARLIEYDYDSSTATTIWTGYVTDYSVSGPVIEVQAQGMWSIIQEAVVNRGAPTLDFRDMPSFASVVSADIVTGGIRMKTGLKSARRVNKGNSTAPHWVAVSIGKEPGGVAFLNWNGTTQKATASDRGSASDGSRAILGGAFNWDTSTAAEVLAIDRFKDQDSTGANPSYANFRSSTRELQYPFHHVAIGLALLTSAYDVTPGEAGTGAAGANPSAPGDTITIENSGPVQYYTSGNQHIWSMYAANLTGQCIIGHTGSSSSAHFACIDDAITMDWESTTSKVSATAGKPGGAIVDAAGEYAYLCMDGTNGTTGGGTNGRCAWTKVAVSDGSEQWFVGSGATAYQFYGVNSIGLDEGADIYTPTDRSSSNALYALTTAAGTGRTFSRAGLNAVTCMCVTPNEDYVICLTNGVTPEIVRFALPVSAAATHDGYPGNEILIDGTDTTNDFGNNQTIGYEGRVVAARDAGSNKVYFCAAESANSNHPYVGRLDPNSGSYGAVDTEVNAVTDSGLTSGSYDRVRDIAVDRWGYVYALCDVDATTWDVVRYDPNLANPFSFITDGGLTMPAIGTYGIPTRLAVDENDSVFVGTRTGYVTRFSQA